MFKRLEATEKRFEELNQSLCDADIIADQNTYKTLMKEFKNLSPIVEKYREYKKEEKNLNESKEILSESGIDKEFKEMAELEIEMSKKNIEKISEELKILLLQKADRVCRDTQTFTGKAEFFLGSRLYVYC